MKPTLDSSNPFFERPVFLFLRDITFDLFARGPSEVLAEPAVPDIRHDEHWGLGASGV